MGESALQNILESGPSGSQGVSASYTPQPDDRSVTRNLLTLQGDAQAKEIIRLWTVQDPLHRKHKAQWKVNRLRRGGISGVVLIKRTDSQEWVAYAPPGSQRQVPILNKAARLCRLLRSTMFVDPPVPEATPSSDSDEDRDGAEFSTRVLIDLGNEGNLNNALTAEQAFDLGAVYGSGFRYYYIDPTGGGKRPYEVRAHPTVMQFDPARPESGITDPMGKTLPPPYVTKYVREDFTLADKPNDPSIQLRWLPKLRQDVVSGLHIRPLPAVCRDISKAQGALVGTWNTIDVLRRLYPQTFPQDEEGLKRVMTRPSEDVLDLLPGGRANKAVLDTQKITGDSLVFTICCYYKQSGAYPFGFYGCAAGDGVLLRAGEEWYDREQREPLELPIDQFKQMDDGENADDFYGMGLMQVTGPGNEVRAGVLGSQLEHIDRFSNRKVYVPIHSPYQSKMAQAAMGTHIPIVPGGEPKFEQVPEYPKSLDQMFATITQEMQSDAGLEPPATGQNPTSVQSGLHARTIIEQVNVGLSEIRNNVLNGLTRGWRIQLQLVRKYYTVPQRIAWVGDDGVHKERAWRGADLGSTRDVMLHKGSLSMLAPSAKLAVAEQMAAMVVGQQPLIEAEDLRRIVIGNVGGLIGLQDDPHRQRIRRQIGQWSEGPPKDWQPQTAPDPITGQVMPDPLLAGIWAPVPADEDRAVAYVRAHDLARLVASTRYTRWPQQWRGAVDQEYLRMRQAAGILTVAEEQAQMQQAQQQQQQQVDTVNQYAQQVAQFTQVVQQLQQQVAEMGKAIPQMIQQGLAETQQAIQVVAQQVQELAKAQAAGTQDLVKVAQNVDKEMAKLRTEMAAQVAIVAKAADAKVDAVAAQAEQRIRPLEQQAAKPAAPAAAPAPITVYPSAPEQETEFDIERDAQGRATKLTKRTSMTPKKKPPKGPALHPPEPSPITPPPV